MAGFDSRLKTSEFSFHHVSNGTETHGVAWHSSFVICRSQVRTPARWPAEKSDVFVHFVFYLRKLSAAQTIWTQLTRLGRKWSKPTLRRLYGIWIYSQKRRESVQDVCLMFLVRLRTETSRTDRKFDVTYIPRGRLTKHCLIQRTTQSIINSHLSYCDVPTTCFGLYRPSSGKSLQKQNYSRFYQRRNVQHMHRCYR